MDAPTIVALEWIQGIYNLTENPRDMLTTKSKALWLKEGYSLRQLVINVLGADFLQKGKAMKVKYDDREHARIAFIADQSFEDLPEVGMATLKGLWLPLTFEKGYWYVDLIAFKRINNVRPINQEQVV